MIHAGYKWVAVVSLAVLVASGCGAAEPASQEADPSPAAEGATPAAEETVADLSQIDGCLKDGKDGEVVEFQSGDAALRGIVTGSGSTAILFANQFGETVCSWWQIEGGFVKQLEKSYTVMAFDFKGTGDSGFSEDDQWTPDVVAAADELTTRGVEEIVLVGASAGGGAAFAAAPEIENLSALVGLSPAMEFYAADPVSALPAIQVPTLIMVDDTDGDFFEQAKMALPKIGASDKTLQVKGVTGHGINVLRNDPGPKLFLEWLKSRT